MVNKPTMEQQKQNGFSEDTLIKLFFQHYGKSLLKEALLEFLAENELKIVSMKENNPQLLTTHEAAKLLSVNRHTLYKYMNMGLPSFRVGKSHRFRIEDIKAFVALRVKA
jgi:excisionase family DNA binding protein